MCLKEANDQDDAFLRVDDSCRSFSDIETFKRKIKKYRIVLLIVFIAIAAIGIFLIGKIVVDREMQKTKNQNIVNGITHLHYSQIFSKAQSFENQKLDQ